MVQTEKRVLLCPSLLSMEFLALSKSVYFLEQLNECCHCVHYKLMDQVLTYPVVFKKKKERIIGPMENLSFPYGFFGCWGADFTFFINQYHSFLFKLGCGPNTNTRENLLSLWALLTSAASMGLSTLFVWGYSFCHYKLGKFIIFTFNAEPGPLVGQNHKNQILFSLVGL